MADLLQAAPHGYVALSQALSGLFVGAAAGYLFFMSLYRNVHQLLSGQVVSALAGQFMRFAFVASVMMVMAHWGAVPLLASTVGLTFVRYLLVRRLRANT